MGSEATTRNDLGRVPLQLTSFVGRKGELAEAKAQLASSRLATLSGVGGVGKTRLAVRLAEEMRSEFDDGVWLVELEEVGDPALVVHGVAATLGLHDQSAQPLLEVLVGYLTERRLLLILDNCEHLLDACAALALRLLQSCPDVRILATSREPLGIRGEATLSVPPFAVPEGDARLYGEVSGFDAVTLFTERAMAVAPDFRLRDDNQAAVADICHRLDGIPLAIELAAARLRTLPVDEIARRLNEHYQLPSMRMRGVVSRHQTVMASLEWSYDLCSAEEQRLWERLSVFRGGFELDAAEAVCAGGELPPEAILDLVAALVSKSIVLSEPAGPLARYRLLETIREFGSTKLDESGAAQVRRRHRDWYVRFLAEADADWVGPRQLDWLTRMDGDLPNLRAGLEFCLSEPGEAEVALPMAAMLAHDYWLIRGQLSEGRHWLDRTLADSGGRSFDRLRALYLDIVLALLQDDIAAASDLMEQARSLANQLANRSASAYATLGFGFFALWTGQPHRATGYFQDCLDQFREADDVRFQLDALLWLGQSVMAEDERRAVACFEEIVATTKRRGELFYRSWSLLFLGILAWRAGDPQAAATMLTQVLASTSTPRTAASTLEGLAWVSASLHDHGRAATLLGVAQAVADAIGTPTATPPYLVGYHEDCERKARDALGEDAFESAFEDGTRMSLHEAVAYATTLSTEMVMAPPEAADRQPRQSAPLAGSTNGTSAQPKSVKRVLIVDRHRVVADGIQMVLEQHPDLQVVGIATNAGDAVALASETRPDVIVADYQLPDMTGAELAARLRDEQATTHVLLLSSVVSNALLREAVKAGARGFLLKTQPAEQLVDAVRRAGAGEMLIPATRLADFITGSDKDAQLFDLLTGREREVLRQLAAGLDNRHIAARMGIGYVTVRSHLRNLSSKLDAHSKVEILARAAELGLIVR